MTDLFSLSQFWMKKFIVGSFGSAQIAREFRRAPKTFRKHPEPCFGKV